MVYTGAAVNTVKLSILHSGRGQKLILVLQSLFSEITFWSSKNDEKVPLHTRKHTRACCTLDTFLPEFPNSFGENTVRQKKNKIH